MLHNKQHNAKRKPKIRKEDQGFGSWNDEFLAGIDGVSSKSICLFNSIDCYLLLDEKSLIQVSTE